MKVLLLPTCTETEFLRKLYVMLPEPVFVAVAVNTTLSPEHTVVPELELRVNAGVVIPVTDTVLILEVTVVAAQLGLVLDARVTFTL